MGLENQKFPSEVISLPSEGILYSPESSISSGKIEIKYMTAREEDILTSQNLIKQGVVIDKLLQSLIISPISYDELLVGDKNAIMIAARVLGYGKDYGVSIECPACKTKNDINIDLTTLEDKEIDKSKWVNGLNEFTTTLSISKVEVTYKLLTHKDERAIENELKGLKKMAMKSGVDSEITTRLKNTIVAINGDRNPKTIREFVDNMLARDSFELRDIIRDNTPDVDMDILFTCNSCGHEELMMMPMEVGFFWPQRKR